MGADCFRPGSSSAIDYLLYRAPYARLVDSVLWGPEMIVGSLLGLAEASPLALDVRIANDLLARRWRIVLLILHSEVVVELLCGRAFPVWCDGNASLLYFLLVLGSLLLELMGGFCCALLHALVGRAELSNGLDGVNEGNHDGLDELGGFLNFVRRCLLSLLVPFLHSAIYVQVVFSKVFGDLRGQH